MIDIVPVSGDGNEVNEKDDVISELQFIHVWNGKVRLERKISRRKLHLCLKLREITKS